MGKKAQKPIEEFGIKKLSKTELEFMKIIWAHPDGISSEELYANFSQALGTKTTILHRITEKGLVNIVQKGRHYFYMPKISKLEYEQILIKAKLRKEFDIGSLEGMIAAFCGRTKLSEEELRKVQQLLQELKNG
ncbi:penicillinase repressor [Petralouisia muris]|uniref:Penicillinase repressor n=1 Tax=Petralouisia muris TaxID=3032872 RepID=A0AC61RSM5_9FIRM|nr:BlaI/MecI/CopY family transcriptional regulator [Petralouisia muris]TGY92611.1 penicillinase repressor [Petralouisia muris]